ncbi:MAG: L,D-transpeptidase family protein, partial [Prosthecobacter sp.]|nr:L,D-transpeptidase family protein [Prosthecobacter sp.]
MMKPLSCILVLSLVGLMSAEAQSEAQPLPKAPEPIEPILRLQLFLDAKLFCPGKVDGRPGEFTTKALKRYQDAQGLPQTEIEAHDLDLSSITELYTTHVIQQEELRFVGDVPSKPSLQSRKKYLPYASLLEYLTERYHTSPELIEWLNLPTKMSSLKPGDHVRVPKVAEPFLIEQLEPVPRLPAVPEFVDRRIIRIDTREKLLGVYEGDRLLASLPITPGSGHLATPPGTWKIVGISQMPTFRWDEGVLNYGVRTSHA